MAAKTSLLKNVNLYSFSLYCDHFYPFSFSKVSETRGVELLGSLSKFRKRNKFWSSLVYVLNKKEIMEKVWCTSKVVVLPCKPIAFLTTSSLSSRHRSVRYLLTNMADLLEGTFLLLASGKKRYRKIDRCSTKVLAKMPPYKSKW